MTLRKSIAIAAAVNGGAVYGWALKDGQTGRRAGAQAAKGAAIGGTAGLLIGSWIARRGRARTSAA